MFVAMLTVDMPDDVLIVMSGVVVDWLMSVLTRTKPGVLTNIAVAVVDVNANVFTLVMTAFGFMSDPFDVISCCAAFDCRPIAALDSGCVLQAWMPSYHV